MEYIQEKLQLLKNLISSDKWLLVKNVDNVTTKKKFFEDSNIACFSSNGLIKADTNKLSNFVWNVFSSEENMKKYDPNIVKYEVVQNIDDNTRICHQINSLPWPIWPRELVFLQSKVVEPDGTYIYMYSLDTEKVPKQTDKYVRATINISAFAFKAQQNNTLVYRLGHIDPAGMIPTAIINNYGDKTRNMILHMRTIF